MVSNLEKAPEGSGMPVLAPDLDARSLFVIPPVSWDDEWLQIQILRKTETRQAGPWAWVLYAAVAVPSACGPLSSDFSEHPPSQSSDRVSLGRSYKINALKNGLSLSEMKESIPPCQLYNSRLTF